MIVQGDARQLPLTDRSVHCVVTSPPYWGLRDYGVEGQIGLESTPELYVEHLVAVFQQVWRVLRDDGTLWLNLGDSYNAYNGGAGPSSSLSRGAQTTERPDLPTGYGLKYKGLKPKDLVGIPWRVAFALQAGGWYLRSDIIWAKPNPMPESVTDRPTKSHEYLFLLAKSERYYYEAEAIREKGMDEPGTHRGGALVREANGNGRDTTGMVAWEHHGGGMASLLSTMFRNRRSVWTIATQPYPKAHFATFPENLVKPCILAGCPPGGIVLDPFSGSGTVVKVAQDLGRYGVGVELNPAYIALAEYRSSQLGMALR